MILIISQNIMQQLIFGEKNHNMLKAWCLMLYVTPSMNTCTIYKQQAKKYYIPKYPLVLVKICIYNYKFIETKIGTV